MIDAPFNDYISQQGSGSPYHGVDIADHFSQQEC